MRACAYLELGGRTQDLVGGQIHLNGVMDLDEGIRVADGAAIVCDDNRGALGRGRDSFNAAQLVRSLGLSNAVHNKAALGIVQQAEVLIGLIDRDHVLEAARVGKICANLPVNLDVAALDDNLSLLIRERVLETVTDQEDKRNALAKLVRTRRRTGCEHPGQLVKHPVLGRTDALHVLLGSTRHLT